MRPDTAGPADPPGADQRPGRAALLVGLVAAATFIGTLGFDFVWDDLVLIRDNHIVKYARNIPRFFTQDYSVLAHHSIIPGLYRPLLALSDFLDYLLWGLNPAGFHLTNLLFYAGASALVCLLAIRLTGQVPLGLVAGTLFAVHPVHIEPVAFISARVDLMAGFFLLAAVLLYLDGRGRPRAGARWRVASAGCFATALLFKEMAVTLPLVLLFLPPARGAGVPAGESLPLRARREVARLAPHLVVLAVYGAVHLLVSPLRPLLMPGAEVGTPLVRGATALWTVGRYLWMAVFLPDPSPHYRVPLVRTLWGGPQLLAVVTVAGAVWLMVRTWRSAPLVSRGLAWFFVTIIPAANLIHVPGVWSATLAERYLYIPSIGLALAQAGLLVMAERWAAVRFTLRREAARAGLLVIVLIVALPVTLGGMRVWRDDIHLYTQMIRRHPQVGFPYANLAAAWVERGEHGRAEGLATEALKRDPYLPHAYRALAAAYRARGDDAGALAALGQALRMDPTDTQTLMQLGTLLADHGQMEVGIALLRRALAIDPDEAGAYNRMGVAYLRAGEPAKALAALERGRSVSPAAAAIRYNLGLALAQVSRFDEARAELREAIRLRPQDARAGRVLARLAGLPWDIGGRGAWGDPEVR